MKGKFQILDILIMSVFSNSYPLLPYTIKSVNTPRFVFI